MPVLFGGGLGGAADAEEVPAGHEEVVTKGFGPTTFRQERNVVSLETMNADRGKRAGFDSFGCDDADPVGTDIATEARKLAIRFPKADSDRPHQMLAYCRSTLYRIIAAIFSKQTLDKLSDDRIRSVQMVGVHHGKDYSNGIRDAVTPIE